MKLITQSYVDFVTAVKTLSGIDAVLYHDNSPNQFYVYAVIGGKSFVAHAQSLTSKPATFDSDFPDAVALTEPFSVG